MPEPLLTLAVTVDELDALSQLPAAGLLALGVLAFAKGWIITRARFDEMKQDRDYWRSIAMRTLGVAESAIQRNDRGE